MCGRYSLISSLNEIKERFQVKKISGQFLPNSNASPSQQLPLIANSDPERIVLAEWGIIPAWMKDEKRWLNPNIALHDAIKMLKSYPANKMQAAPLNGPAQKRQINELPRLI